MVCRTGCVVRPNPRKNDPSLAHALCLLVCSEPREYLSYVEVLSSDGFYTVCCACVHRRMIKSWPSGGNFPPPSQCTFASATLSVACELIGTNSFSSCVCVQDVSSKFPPSLFPEFALIPCPLLSFACFTLRSGMRNGFLTSFFSYFVQGVRLARPSSLLPAELFSKGLVLCV